MKSDTKLSITIQIKTCKQMEIVNTQVQQNT